MSVSTQSQTSPQRSEEDKTESTEGKRKLIANYTSILMYLTDTDVFLKTLTPIHEEMEIPSPVQFIKDCDKKEHEGKH